MMAQSGTTSAKERLPDLKPVQKKTYKEISICFVMKRCVGIRRFGPKHLELKSGSCNCSYGHAYDVVAYESVIFVSLHWDTLKISDELLMNGPSGMTSSTEAAKPNNTDIVKVNHDVAPPRLTRASLVAISRDKIRTLSAGPTVQPASHPGRLTRVIM